MAKFCGVVGYATSVERSPGDGVFVDDIIEVTYFGDVLRNSRRLESGGDLNSDISVSNSISIVADEYAVRNFMAIRYVEWAGAFWSVINVQVESPRLLLQLGGVYNGPKASRAPGSP